MGISEGISLVKGNISFDSTSVIHVKGKISFQVSWEEFPSLGSCNYFLAGNNLIIPLRPMGILEGISLVKGNISFDNWLITDNLTLDN